MVVLGRIGERGGGEARPPSEAWTTSEARTTRSEATRMGSDVTRTRSEATRMRRCSSEKRKMIERIDDDRVSDEGAKGFSFM